MGVFSFIISLQLWPPIELKFSRVCYFMYIVEIYKVRRLVFDCIVKWTLCQQKEYYGSKRYIILAATNYPQEQLNFEWVLCFEIAWSWFALHFHVTWLAGLYALFLKRQGHHDAFCLLCKGHPPYEESLIIYWSISRAPRQWPRGMEAITSVIPLWYQAVILVTSSFCPSLSLLAPTPTFNLKTVCSAYIAH